jgi:hypothetical protein
MHQLYARWKAPSTYRHISCGCRRPHHTVQLPWSIVAFPRPMHYLDSLSDLYLTMDAQTLSGYSSEAVDDTRPTSDMARSYQQNTPPPASNDIRRSIERSFSNASQIGLQIQQNGVAHDGSPNSPASNRQNPRLLRHSSLPLEDKDISDELNLRNGDKSANPLLSQVNGGLPRHRRSQSQLQIRPPLDPPPNL